MVQGRIDKKSPEKKTPNLRYQRDKDREMVKGIFRFNEVPGGSLSFVYRKYKEDPIERFDMVDGEMYTIPLGVAKHINNDMWYPVHSHALDENNKSHVRIGKKVRRANFQSLEFVDIDELDASNDIITVEKI